jgi:preprotein translocase subunit SecE
MAKFGTYVQEAYDELVHKVSWPSWTELQKTTGIVLIGLLVITLLIFGYDALCKAVMDLVYSLA